MDNIDWGEPSFEQFCNELVEESMDNQGKTIDEELWTVEELHAELNKELHGKESGAKTILNICNTHSLLLEACEETLSWIKDKRQDIKRNYRDEPGLDTIGGIAYKLESAIKKATKEVT